jgi:hypothetical protein
LLAGADDFAVAEAGVLEKFSKARRDWGRKRIVVQAFDG